MTSEIKKVIVRVPHRISGFFEIVDSKGKREINNPVKIGSRGAGFNLSAYGTTMIIANSNHNNLDSECEIYINGVKKNLEAETTHYIFQYIKNRIKTPIKIRINHNFELPVEAGYGASGSGALGSILGLNQILDLKLSIIECGKIAHIAEVINKTGLGTVCGQLGGGLCILKEPGYPCNFQRIAIPDSIKVICTTFGKIHTKSILSDPVLRQKIMKYGQIALKKLIIKPDIYTFMQCSYDFIKKTEIMDILNLSITKDLIKDLRKESIIGASMNQLGRSVYAICDDKNTESVMKVFENYQENDKIFILNLDDKKPNSWFRA